MLTVEWYRRQARDAEILARFLSLNGERDRLLAEAAHWRRLADAAEDRLRAAAGARQETASFATTP
jgi:hypothetical protein